MDLPGAAGATGRRTLIDQTILDDINGIEVSPLIPRDVNHENHPIPRDNNHENDLIPPDTNRENDHDNNETIKDKEDQAAKMTRLFQD